MRFGLISLSTSPAKMLEAATVSEQLGYDALYAADHLFAYFAADWPFLDGWATLGAWVQNTTIVAAHGPKALRVAALRGDVWSSYGGVEDLTVDELVAVTQERNEGLRAACESVGRDPASIGRSLLLMPNNGVDPWGDPDALRAFAEHLHAMKFDELVLGFPSPDRRETFERTSLDVLPQLR